MKAQLFQKRTIYLPTWQGGLAIVGVLLATGAAVTLNLYRFLAASDSIDGTGAADVLVMEGWAPPNVVGAAAELYKNGQFEFLATSGGRPVGNAHLLPFDSFSELGAHGLREAGVQSPIIVVPIIERSADRTRTDTLAVRMELERREIEPTSITVVSVDVHTRRSRMIYRRVFGDSAPVKAVAIDPSGYSKDEWWSNSFGAKSVISEAIAYTFEALRITQ